MRSLLCSQAVARSLELVFSLTVMVGISGEQYGALTRTQRRSILIIKNQGRNFFLTAHFGLSVRGPDRLKDVSEPSGFAWFNICLSLKGLYFLILKVLATPSCDICLTVQRPDTKKCQDQTSQVHLFPKVPPDCAITVGGFRLRLCLGWLL